MVLRNPSGMEFPFQESSKKKRTDILPDTVIEVKHLLSDPEITYNLVEEIGGGSEGSVYKAVAEDGSGSKRVVAFKEFHNVPSDEQRRHLEREMHLRKELTGVPGVASYITHGYTAGKKLRFALVSEYIDGQTLDQLVQQGKDFAGKRFTEEEAKEFLYQALTCVGEFHKRGIIHRDIKPSNILITEKGVQFPDLGLVCDATRSTLTATIAGSPEYVAPEQILQKPLPASDIYSLGMTMWFLMTTEHPNIPLHRIFDTDTEDLDFSSLIPRGYSKDFVGIVEKMSQKNVQQRYATVDEVLHDCEMGHVTMPLVKPDKRTLQRKTGDAIISYISATWETILKIWHAIPYASLGTGQYGLKVALRNKAENFTGVGISLWDSHIDISKGVSFAFYENAVEKNGYGVQLAGILNAADHAYGVQLAVGGNAADHAYGVQLAGFGNGADHAYGVQLAGFGNLVDHAYGVQLAGVLNEAKHDMHGVQLAVVGNLADHAYGVQLAGFTNWPEHAYGVQLAGIRNGVDNDMYGVQLAGFLNEAKHAYGLQAGSVNISLEELVGVQTGLVCYANHGKYVQFGLLTIRGNQGYKSLIPITGWSPLIGFRWEKKE